MVYLQVYYKEAVGAFVVFDVTKLSTFFAVQMWKSDLDNKVLLPNGKPIPAVLLANKVVFNTVTLQFIITLLLKKVYIEKKNIALQI